MTAPLDRIVLQMLDLKDQPSTPYVFFSPAEHRSPIAIDGWDVYAAAVHGWRRIDGVMVTVVAMPADKGWVVYHRSLLREMTTDESLREGVARSKALAILERELGTDRELSEQPGEGQVIVVSADGVDDRRGYL